jgi:hypothetical protein
MGLDTLQYANLSEICRQSPAAPIEDDDSYRAVIEILDRLFAREDLRTPIEMAYFRTLAQMACEYEMNRDIRGSSL